MMLYNIALCVEELKTLGRKQGFLSFLQVYEHLPSAAMDQDLDSVLAELKRAGVRVVAEGSDDPDAPVGVTPSKPKPPKPLAQSKKT